MGFNKEKTKQRTPIIMVDNSRSPYLLEPCVTYHKYFATHLKEQKYQPCVYNQESKTFSLRYLWIERYLFITTFFTAQTWDSRDASFLILNYGGTFATVAEQMCKAMLCYYTFWSHKKKTHTHISGNITHVNILYNNKWALRVFRIHAELCIFFT